MTRGILVAGGEGRRLGLGVAKALAVVGGETLLGRALSTLEKVCDETVVAAPAGMALPIPAGARPVLQVEDLEAGAGPLAGVTAALGGSFERAIVLGVDFPLARASALAAILERLTSSAPAAPSSPASAAPVAVVPAPGGRLQPLFAAYARPACDALLAAFRAGERSMVRVVERLDPLVLETAALQSLPGGLDNLFNLNTVEDLAMAEERLAREIRS